MLDALVALALAHGSTALADPLHASIRQHAQPKLTAVTLRMVTEAAQLAALPPHADYPIGAWFRPRVARRLKGEGIATLGDLVAFCNRRGGSWWRSIPRIGPAVHVGRRLAASPRSPPWSCASTPMSTRPARRVCRWSRPRSSRSCRCRVIEAAAHYYADEGQ